MVSSPVKLLMPPEEQLLIMMRVASGELTKTQAWCAFSDRKLHSRGCHWITRVFASSEHACDQWHTSRKFILLPGDTVNCVATLKAEAMIDGVDEEEEFDEPEYQEPAPAVYSSRHVATLKVQRPFHS
jgi:hypothetical protein